MQLAAELQAATDLEEARRPKGTQVQDTPDKTSPTSTTVAVPGGSGRSVRKERNDPCQTGGTTACLDVRIPVIGPMPQVQATWEGSPPTAVAVTLRAYGLRADEPIAVRVSATNENAALYEASIGPDAKGSLDVSFKVPIAATVQGVCVSASLGGNRTSSVSTGASARPEPGGNLLPPV